MLPDEGSLGDDRYPPPPGLLALAAADGHTVPIYDPKRLVRSGALPYDATIYERAAGCARTAAGDSTFAKRTRGALTPMRYTGTSL